MKKYAVMRQGICSDETGKCQKYAVMRQDSYYILMNF